MSDEQEVSAEVVDAPAVEVPAEVVEETPVEGELI